MYSNTKQSIRALVVLAVSSGAVWAEGPLLTGLSLDRARYAPGEAPAFSLELDSTPSSPLEARVHYWRQGALVATTTTPVTTDSASWSWNAPNADFEGYLAEVELVSGDTVLDRRTIGVDVSSDWTRFPRYGFLSKYPLQSQTQTDAVLDQLQRFHINGLQFYDWHHEHHDPLRGTAAAPSSSWRDVAGRRNYLSTVRGYVDGARDRGIASMSYNLAYGALDSGPTDGVQSDWYLYTDAAATTVDVHPLPQDWVSDISLLNPESAGWRDYLATKTAEAFDAIDFDGWHIDQLGDRGGPRYNAAGAVVDLPGAMGSFLADMRSRFPDKTFAFNAVNQYAQADIAAAGTDFLYTEVWQPNEHFNDLATIIKTNNALGGGGLPTVLAAYMNYDQSSSPGVFNTPAVLLTDAMIFAHGGAHIELGEHMLGNEYFPNDNLQVSGDLQTQLVDYYDFKVGYQNLLRGEGDFGVNPLTSTTTALSQGVAEQGKVAVVNRQAGSKEVFHLINFADAVHMNWRDTDATQVEPQLRESIPLSFNTQDVIERLWVASPDVGGGAPQEIPFSQSLEGDVSFELPSLKYWSMVVAESDPSVQTFHGDDHASQPVYASSGWGDGTNGGAGFGPWRLVSESTTGGFAGFFRQATPGTGVDNAGTPTPADGATFASFANKGDGIDAATAFRSFDLPIDSEGDAFSVTVEHGFVSGRVGVALRSGNESTEANDHAEGSRVEFYFNAGDANYTILDADGTPFDTGVPFTLFGVDIEVELTGSDTYDLTISRFDEPGDLSPQVFSFLGRTLGGGGPIESLALYQFDAPNAADSTIQSDVYYNNLHYRVLQQVGLPGDYNEDGVVDAADYTVWRDALGDPDSLPNDDTPGVGPDDYDRWKRHFGRELAPPNAAGAAVPEPSSLLLASFGLSGLGWGRR